MVRTLSNPKGDARTQHARAPLQMLEGTITPNPLHFTILHSGIPDIDPDKHVLVIHGQVKQPLEFTVEALSRYPMVTRKHFVECGGNSAPMFSPEPIQATVQALHGLSSCAEWTGVPLSILLDEAGADPSAKWLIAEGADSLAVSRSVPMKKAYDDAMVALYQNGERLMPGNGYPMRLLSARLRRQYEHQIPAPAQSRRSAGDDLLRVRATIRRCCRTARPTSSISSMR